MIGLFIIAISSWIFLKFFKMDFSALGFKPTKSRIIDFGIGFTVSALICFIYFSLLIWLLEVQIELNENYYLEDFVFGFWWTFRSVLLEELLFRGALLIIAIKFLGELRACILSSIIFGIYHWFSYDVFGSLMPMLHVFIITGVGGLMFAYAYAKTRSLYLPVALHFGWNLVTITVFSEGPIGEQFLITSGGRPTGYLYIASFMYQILVLQLLTLFYLKNFRKKFSLKNS